MGTEGYNLITTKKDNTWRQYEDYASLKKYLNANMSKSTPGERAKTYDKDKVYEINTHLTQTSTGTQAELESTDSIAIAQIGATELTLLLAGDADNASTNGKTYTLIYKDSAGASQTAVGTGTATLNGTPVAFVPAVTDFYEAVSFTPSAADANVNVYAATAGIAAIYATVATTETATNPDACLGVGTIYGRTHTNHDDGDGDVLHMDYFTPWGDFVKNATCTINTTDGTTEVIFRKTTTAGVLQTLVNNTAVTSTLNANDIWYIVDLWTNSAPTANTHEHLITDADCANVDGSGGDVYGVIKETEFSSTFTRFRVPIGFDGWVAEFEFQSPAVTATGDDIIFQQYFFPDGYSTRKLYSHNFRNEYKGSHPFKLEEEKDMYVTMADVGNPMECSYEAIYILAKRNTIS
jgi:hypothetical protein